MYEVMLLPIPLTNFPGAGGLADEPSEGGGGLTCPSQRTTKKNLQGSAEATRNLAIHMAGEEGWPWAIHMAGWKGWLWMRTNKKNLRGWLAEAAANAIQHAPTHMTG